MATAKLGKPTRSAQNIQGFVVQDPLRAGRMYGRLKGHDVPVWAIIQHLVAEYNLDDPLNAPDAAVRGTAKDFDIPATGVRAAIAYYAENRSFIDAKIDSNAAGTSR